MKTIGALFLFVFLSGWQCVQAQISEKQLSSLSDSQFEIIISDYLYTDGVATGGSKSLIMTVFVSSKALIEEESLKFSERVEDFLVKEDIDGITIIFFTDRNIAERFFSDVDFEDEESSLAAIRGLYLTRRNPARTAFKHFPSGMKESDLDDLLKDGGN
ncbi:MAG: hypothetical protein KF855_12995 [Acidobacteria bacterium]|nr:hypothetical protein [Acidobacteriota bacterium]